MQQANLTNQFLISMPNLKDPNFEKTVTYICIHNEEGAMGIIINKPLDSELGEIFEQMDISVKAQDINKKKIYHGGPIHTDRGFILHQTNKEWSSSVVVSSELCVTTSKDILEAIAKGDGPADLEIIFNTSSEQCWQSAASHVGIDIDKLSTDVGHA